MSQVFQSFWTLVGQAKIADALATGTPILITEMAVGDADYTPTPGLTALLSERWRGSIASADTDVANPNWLNIEGVITSSIGGFYIREIGLFDDVGDLLVISRYPEAYKPTLREGSVTDLVVQLTTEIQNVESVTFVIDPTVAIASRKYVDDAIEAHRQEANPHPRLAVIDEIARDRAALNALRIMSSTSITTAEHVAGHLWELETDEWGASSADEAHVVTAGLNFYANLPERLINPTVEATAVTPSGTLQVNRPVSELFNGLTTFDVLGGGGASTTTNVLIQWPAARVISRARAFLGIDPLNGNRGRADLYGSQDNVNFTLIGSTGSIGPFTGFLDINLTDTTTSYNFHIVQIVSTTDGVRIRELELYEDAGGGDMTLTSPALPAAARPADPPDLVTAYFLYRDASGGARLGTDLTVRGSRDGVSFIPGAPEVLAAYDGDWSFVKASFDLSGEPPGVDLRLEIATVGGREQRVAGPCLYWG